MFPGGEDDDDSGAELIMSVSGVSSISLPILSQSKSKSSSHRPRL